MNIIYVKYDGQISADLFKKVETIFGSYNWGAGFSVCNFRLDQNYLYCDMDSSIFDRGSSIAQQTASYIQGMISGYLVANGTGVEIL